MKIKKTLLFVALLVVGVLAVKTVTPVLSAVGNGEPIQCQNANQAGNKQANFAGCDDSCTLPLYEKDASWVIVSEGASGTMAYDHDSLTVMATGLNASINYTLIEYPEPQTTWPWPIIEIVSGDTNASGKLSLSANYSVKAGEKYWIVLSSHIVAGEMSGWNLSEYLFEGFLIPDDECLATPSPTPTPELTPTPSPEPTPEPEHVPNIQPAGWVGRCYGHSHPVIPWASATRNGTSASIDYVPTTGEGDKVNVVFSENPFEIIFGLGSHGLRDWTNNGHVEINDLVPGQPYWYRVANGCSWWSKMWQIPAN